MMTSFIIGITNLELFFLKVKQTLTHNCALALPNTKNSFLVMVDGFAFGSIVVFQADDKGQMQGKPFKSRFFTEGEQKCGDL